MNKVVKFKTTTENLSYRHGDLNKAPYITVEGVGNLITFVTPEVAIVESFDGKFYQVQIKNLTSFNANKE